MSVDTNQSSKMLSSVPPDLEKRGCGTSFLNGKRNEINQLCGGAQAMPPEEYVQPDEEKEAGGES
jgi:hypothetical protein